jgi:capsular exopolysaccharide synthesis family protein
MNNLVKLPRELRGINETASTLSTESEVESSERNLDLQAFLAAEVNLQPKSRLIFHADPRSGAADRYRFLRMRLRELCSIGKLKTVLVTSPLPEDGKSTTVINLATALADHGKNRVLLIEADLYHSPLVTMLGLDPAPGLAECMESGLDLRSAIRKLHPLEWFFLPAGKPQGNPTELLNRDAFVRMMRQVVSSFDWVLIDSPPVLPLVDALMLKRHADGTLLVARAGHTPRKAIEQSLSLLGQDHILGIVLNATEKVNQPYAKYSNYYLAGQRKNGK